MTRLLSAQRSALGVAPLLFAAGLILVIQSQALADNVSAYAGYGLGSQDIEVWGGLILVSLDPPVGRSRRVPVLTVPRELKTTTLGPPPQTT